MIRSQKASRLNTYFKEFNQGITILEINLKNISKNYKILYQLSKPGDTAAVLKADAYGCGINEVAKTLSEEGCNVFFVAKLDEGIKLRKKIPKSKKIAIFDGYLHQDKKLWQKYDLIPVCNTTDQIINASNDKIKYMMHIDTGMNRLGLSLKDAHKLLENDSNINHHYLVLILSHFICSDNKKSKLNSVQIEEFKKFNNYLPHIKRSMSNSHGIFLGKEAKFDLSRPGIGLYGYTNNEDFNFNPAISVFSPILQIRKPNIGETVGYDATYKITKKSILGVLGLGYADGLKRCINTRKDLSLGKYNVPILGRVSMDTVIIDLTKIPEKILNNINHIPIIDENYSIFEMARDCSTIPYEIITSFGNRLKRVYI